jgi:hypothetical protein
VLILLSEAAKHDFIANLQHALLVWLALILIAAGGFAAVTAAANRGLHLKQRWLDHKARKAVKAERRIEKSRSERQKVRELRRYAEEVGVAAERAAVMARRRHADWIAVQRTQEAAWRAYEVAEAEVRRFEEAARFPALAEEHEAPADEMELSYRRRRLHRIATAAHERGEMSAEQLSDALFHRNGWDPASHPFVQDAMLREVVRERRLRAYQEASMIERAAWHAADMAAAARRSLEDEAFTAALRARQAQPAKVTRASVSHGVRRELVTAG